MAANRATDLVTLVSLHAALDGIVEIEALLAQSEPPIHASTTGNRIGALASELRALLVAVLSDRRVS